MPERVTSEKCESAVEKEFFSLQETDISSYQTIWKNVPAAPNLIDASNDLSSRYVVMEAVAVTTLDVTGVVAYTRWQLQSEEDAILVLICQYERHIMELIIQN